MSVMFFCSVHLMDNCLLSLKVRKRAKIRNRYNQVPRLTQDTNGKVTTSQLDITNESQEVSPFPTGDHKAAMNRRDSMRDITHKYTNDPQKKYRLGTVSNFFFTGGLKPVSRHAIHILSSDMDQDTKMFGLHERLLTY